MIIIPEQLRDLHVKNMRDLLSDLQKIYEHTWVTAIECQV